MFFRVIAFLGTEFLGDSCFNPIYVHIYLCNNKLFAQPSILRGNKRYLFMVSILPKEIGYTKIDYLDLLLENPDGITASEISEIYFDVTKDAAGHALRRLKKQVCLRETAFWTASILPEIEFNIFS